MESESVMGVETPLNTMSIALQNGRERNQKGLSKQMASAIPPLKKGKKPQVPSAWAQKIQEFENQIKMPKGTESVHNVPPYNTKSH